MDLLLTSFTQLGYNIFLPVFLEQILGISITPALPGSDIDYTRSAQMYKFVWNEIENLNLVGLDIYIYSQPWFAIFVVHITQLL